jgi:hypothetical protein
MYYPRNDGSVTVIDSEYWQVFDRIQRDFNFMAGYQHLADRVELVIFKAKQDKAVGDIDLTPLQDKAQTIEMTADHNFSAPARAKLLKKLREVLA